jgi:hypothetical protein
MAFVRLHESRTDCGRIPPSIVLQVKTIPKAERKNPIFALHILSK